MVVAELGQTADPKALIGGDPAAVRATIGVLDKFGDALVTAGNGLIQLDDGGWTGQAADAFHEWFDGEPARWIGCGEAFSSAATALTIYVGVLEWAQGQAGEALRLWNEGEAATARAKADHQREVAQANQQAAATGTTAPSIPFVDPGEAKRTEAQGLLATARSQLHTAGEQADTTVGQARDKAPEKPSLLGRIGETLGDFGRGVWEGVTGLAEFAWQVSPTRMMIDPAGYAHDMLGLAAGLSTAVTNPKEFFKTVVDWDTWKDNPARALGRLVPDLALALGTGGAGTAAARSARAGKAATKLGTGARALQGVLVPRGPRTIDLKAYEALGGHSIARHGPQLSLSELRQRVLGTHPAMPQSRTATKFTNEFTHAEAVDKAHLSHKADVDAHFANPRNADTISRTFDYESRTGVGFENVGTRGNPDARPVETTKVTVVYRRDANAPNGYRIHTAYPGN
ncbi:MAG: putative T7SS-secreted protein [Egibacteraceae bacterium]